MKGSLHGHDSSILIGALLIPGTGICSLAEGTAGVTDIVTCELGSLKQNRLSGVTDLGIQTAHHACERHGTDTVTDAQCILIHFVILLIQRRDHLIFVSAADQDPSFPDEILIEGVHRLSQFHQDIVGDIHDVGNGIHSYQSKPSAHPSG